MTMWGMFAMQDDVETWNFGIVQCSFAKFHFSKDQSNMNHTRQGVKTPPKNGKKNYTG